jgi:acyl carrier protein
MDAAANVDATNDLAVTESRVCKMILERLYIDVPTNDTDLFGTGIIDSLGLVELLLGLKEEMGVEIDIETVDLGALGSVERIALIVVERNRAEGGQSQRGDRTLRGELPQEVEQPFSSGFVCGSLVEQPIRGAADRERLKPDDL